MKNGSFLTRYINGAQRPIIIRTKPSSATSKKAHQEFPILPPHSHISILYLQSTQKNTPKHSQKQIKETSLCTHTKKSTRARAKTLQRNRPQPKILSPPQQRHTSLPSLHHENVLVRSFSRGHSPRQPFASE